MRAAYQKIAAISAAARQLILGAFGGGEVLCNGRVTPTWNAQDELARSTVMLTGGARHPVSEAGAI